MLTQLQIRDFAIVEHLELDLEGGMSTLTGETGAGKSIVVDALGLLLGDRADSSVVRHAAERADISAVFDLSLLPEVRAWLAERELGSGQECHLRRVISRYGRSKAYIDGIPQPLQVLRELGEQLVDIHGQHEHQSLLKRELQRQLLDDYAGNQELLTELAGHYETWRQRRRKLEALRQAGQERDARLDFLRFQVQELQALHLQAGELAALDEEQRRLANAGRLLESCQRALGWLYENDELAVQGLLNQTLHEVVALSSVDARLAPVGELLNSVLIQVREASDELRQYLQQLDLDPARLEWVEQRLAAIHTLARKHRQRPEELPAWLERLQRELEELDHSELHQAQLEQQAEQALQTYSRNAEMLGKRRAEAAAVLAEKVSAAMQGLGMPEGRLAIDLEHQDKPSPQGLETVEFLVSANPGQPLRPLSKVASGGELSRISLAIQVIAAHSARIPTLIFDEVDTGIGGGTAEVVGRQLRTLGKTRQVLCVTHLPQVAAQAHQHFQVSKQTDGRSTRALIAKLKQEERVQEIARMLGGVELTAKTQAHAREMIEVVGKDQGMPNDTLNITLNKITS
jgi:DNA repair protein RecN (Recombination protein N)